MVSLPILLGFTWFLLITADFLFVFGFSFCRPTLHDPTHDRIYVLPSQFRLIIPVTPLSPSFHRQIVHGLRDEDDDFMYPTRNSFASEYSTQENDNGLQIFVKEHARSGSKGSTTSYLSRRRPAATVNYGKARPETKVCVRSTRG